jgi:hypothetical protein
MHGFTAGSPNGTSLYGSPLSFLFFQLFIDDIPLDDSEFTFMDDPLSLLPNHHSPPSRTLLSFFGEVIPTKKQVKYLRIKLAAQINYTDPWSLSTYLADIADSIKQRSPVFSHLRCPRFKIARNVLRTIFQGWICGLIRYYLPIFGSTADEKLTVRFRIGLRALTFLPRNTRNSILQAAPELPHSSTHASL